MATVQLADIYNPLTFAQYAQEDQLELNRFITSGVLVQDPRLSSMASTGGNVGELPFFNPLGTEEPNYSNDNPAVDSTPAKIDSGKMKFRLASQNKSWSVMDLSRELALEDPVGAITGRIGSYWATNNEKRAIQSAMGVLADNVANDGGDMVNVLANDAAGAPTADEIISSDAIIDTVQTMGDHGEQLAVMAVHSVVYRNLQKQKMIEFFQENEGSPRIPMYQDKMVIVDDSLPAIAGANRVTYTSVLFTRGAMVGGEGRVNVPSEMLRKPDAGNGGGEERIYSRRADIIHPLGFSFESAAVAGQSATQAELANALNWNRVFNRKNVGIAFLQTNG